MNEAEYIAAQAAGWIDIGDFHREYNRNPAHLRPETADGPGATLALTKDLIPWLSDLLRRHHVTSMLDIACGDWAWLRMVDLGDVEYTGWDVDPGRIETCRYRLAHADYAGCGFMGASRPNAVFEVVNVLTVDVIPGGYDLVLAREFLTHIPNEHVLAILNKLRSGDDPAQGDNVYLLASTFPGADNTQRAWDPARATWQGYLEAAIDLSAEPFLLGEPVESFKEVPGPHGILTVPRELALFKL